MAVGASELFLDFGMILLVAGAVALLFYKLRQPVVLGYLLAGFLVGPFSPGPSFVSDVEVMGFLGEIGIVFLLFALGLEFNLGKVRKVGAVAILAGTIEIALMLGLGYGLGQLLGWTPLQSIFLGAIMSISSTTVIVKVLTEMKKKDEDWAQTAFGILIIEDVLAVLILTALSSAGATGGFAPGQLGALLWKLGVFLGAAVLLGLLFAPRIVDRLAVVKVEEVMVILATGIGFGMAILAAYLGFSAGLGAFVAGALLAESPRVAKIEQRITPLRDVFTAIFFVTVGAALDPAAVLANWLPILLITLAVVGGKILAVGFATFVTGAQPSKALRVGMTLAQIGEFAFIIAALAVGLGAADASLYAIAITVCALSAFLTPYLIRASPGVARSLARAVPTGVHAYATTYSAWVARMRRSDRRGEEWRAIRRNAVTASLNGAVIVALFAAAATFGEAIPARFRIIANAHWILASLLITPFAYMWVREVQHIIVNLARLAVPQRLRHVDPTTAERLLRRTFALVAIVLTAAVCILIAGVFVENVLPVLALAAIGVVIGSVVLGQSLGRFHDEVERTLENMTGGAAKHAATREEAMHMLEHAHAWGAGGREVRLPTLSGAGGRSIGALRLRELTGASVVSVHRDETDAPITNPGPALVFAAGDIVMLVGDDASLTRAEEILLGRDLGIEGGATEVRLPARFAGSLLRDAPITEGVDVLLVWRAGSPVAAEPHLLLADGDVLVLTGADDAVEATRIALAST